jgi:hypothetical protein
MLALLLTLTSLVACGKIPRDKTEPEAQSSTSTSIQLDQWSGRSDYFDTRWQVKTQP